LQELLVNWSRGKTIDALASKALEKLCASKCSITIMIPNVYITVRHGQRCRDAFNQVREMDVSSCLLCGLFLYLLYLVNLLFTVIQLICEYLEWWVFLTLDGISNHWSGPSAVDIFINKNICCQELGDASNMSQPNNESVARSNIRKQSHLLVSTIIKLVM
jgi:hypothetical protein